jgi:hypothetical protein
VGAVGVHALSEHAACRSRTPRRRHRCHCGWTGDAQCTARPDG